MKIITLRLALFFVIFSVVNLLVGCASMSKEECLTADWKMVGLENGINGSPESTIGTYRKDCAKTGVVPDLVQYQQGYREGVKKYCTAAKGYDVGKTGGAYYHVCPAELESYFLTAYKKGQDLYAITQKIQQLKADITNTNSRIDEIRNNIKVHEKAIVDAASSSSSRKEHLTDINTLNNEQRDLIRRVEDDNREVLLYEDDYQNMAAQHRRLGY